MEKINDKSALTEHCYLQKRKRFLTVPCKNRNVRYLSACNSCVIQKSLKEATQKGEFQAKPLLSGCITTHHFCFMVWIRLYLTSADNTMRCSIFKRIHLSRIVFGTRFLGGKAERAGAAQPGEEKAPGRP